MDIVVQKTMVKTKKTLKNFIKKVSIRWYFYTVKEVKSEERVRLISKKQNTQEFNEVFKSRMNSHDRKLRQDVWEFTEQNFGFNEYVELIRAAQRGGEASSRRIWKNEAEKQQAKRAKKNWLAGKKITELQRELLIRARVIAKKPNLDE